MPRPTIEQMFVWANNPPEWQYIGYAHSQDDLDDLHDTAVEGRRAFLLKVAQHEMARRALVASQEPTIERPHVEARFDFSSIPIRRTITLRDCEALASIHQYHKVMNGERPSWDADYAKRLWREAAHDFGFMNGYDETSHKFSDRLFQPWNARYRGDKAELTRIAEEHFEQMLESTASNERAGYSLHFMMDGVLRIEDACIDVDSLEQMVRKQQRREAENRYFYDYRLGFWKDMVKAKREFDKKGPHRAKNTYADIVDEIAPGVYTAPYIDTALVASRQFISIDDWRRACLAVDEDKDASRLVKGFNIAVSLVSKGDRWGSNRRYYSEQDPLNTHGAVFFDRALLSKAYNILEHERAGKFIMPMLEYLIAEGEKEPGDRLDPDYLKIVFGTGSVSNEVADVLQS